MIVNLAGDQLPCIVTVGRVRSEFSKRRLVTPCFPLVHRCILERRAISVGRRPVRSHFWRKLAWRSFIKLTSRAGVLVAFDRFRAEKSTLLLGLGPLGFCWIRIGVRFV